MKKSILILLSILALSITNLNATYYQPVNDTDEGTPVSDPEIIINNASTTDDNRENTFPFSVEYDELTNSLSVNYYQDRQAYLDLTNNNGVTISRQTLPYGGHYTVSIPSKQGIYYLFMTTPYLCAYVTITP